jgi:pilus assembly protein TadC
MVLVYAAAIAWGGLVLAAGRRVSARAAASDRARALGDDAGPATRWPNGTAIDDALARLGIVGGVALGARRRRVAARRDRRLARELPAAIDLLAVAMSAGATPFGAVEAVARWSPPAIGESFGAVVVACGLGASFEHAMTDAARRDARLGPLVTVIAGGSRLGAAVNDALARLAGEARRDLRRRAEARARTVPVRLLFPLVFLVLPAFGLLTVVPAVVAGFHGL